MKSIASLTRVLRTSKISTEGILTRGFRCYVPTARAMTASPTPSLKRAAEEDDNVSPPPVKRKATTGAINKKAVANFFKPASQKEPESMAWTTRNHTLLTAKFQASSRKLKPLPEGAKRKIAAFDFDSTVIMTKSGNRFPKDAADWQWWHRSVPGKLRQLYEDSYVVAIVSNQGGISLKTDSKTVKLDKKRFSDFKQKAATVFNQLDIPISLYAATEKDGYRKPRVGMWKTLLDDHGLTDEMVDLDGSIFVGDAAGRPADGARKKDHSCSDRDLAANIGIPFHTPEEFFLGECAKPFERTFDPSKYVQPIDASPILFSKRHDLDLIIFVGSPGAGKSTFYKKHLAPLGYARVNQDILKSRDKCVKVASDHLQEKESVVVDNTNRDRATRKVWIDLAKKFGVPIRCIWFTADPALCQHNDVVRALNEGHNPEKRTMLPGNAFPMYRNAFEAPDVEEGFEDLTTVDFTLEGSEEDKKLWSMYWV